MSRLTKTEKQLIYNIVEKVAKNFEDSEVSEPANDFYATDESLLFSCDKEDLEKLKNAVSKIDYWL